MSVQMICSHCNKMQAPRLNPKTEDVFCELCDGILHVNHFTKIQLKTLRQYAEPKKIAFGIKCKSCDKEEKPKILNSEIVCGACEKPLTHLSETFKHMLKIQLVKIDKDV